MAVRLSVYLRTDNGSPSREHGLGNSTISSIPAALASFLSSPTRSHIGQTHHRTQRTAEHCMRQDRRELLKASIAITVLSLSNGSAEAARKKVGVIKAVPGRFESGGFPNGFEWVIVSALIRERGGYRCQSRTPVICVNALSRWLKRAHPGMKPPSILA